MDVKIEDDHNENKSEKCLIGNDQIITDDKIKSQILKDDNEVNQLNQLNDNFCKKSLQNESEKITLNKNDSSTANIQTSLISLLDKGESECTNLSSTLDSKDEFDDDAIGDDYYQNDEECVSPCLDLSKNSNSNSENHHYLDSNDTNSNDLKTQNNIEEPNLQKINLNLTKTINKNTENTDIGTNLDINSINIKKIDNLQNPQIKLSEIDNIRENGKTECHLSQSLSLSQEIIRNENSDSCSSSSSVALVIDQTRELNTSKGYPLDFSQALKNEKNITNSPIKLPPEKPEMKIYEKQDEESIDNSNKHLNQQTSIDQTQNNLKRRRSIEILIPELESDEIKPPQHKIRHVDKNNYYDTNSKDILSSFNSKEEKPIIHNGDYENQKSANIENGISKPSLSTENNAKLADTSVNLTEENQSQISLTKLNSKKNSNRTPESLFLFDRNDLLDKRSNNDSSSKKKELEQPLINVRSNEDLVLKNDKIELNSLANLNSQKSIELTTTENSVTTEKCFTSNKYLLTSPTKLNLDSGQNTDNNTNNVNANAAAPLIDLTNDSTDGSHAKISVKSIDTLKYSPATIIPLSDSQTTQNTILTPKEKILQEWNKKNPPQTSPITMSITNICNDLTTTKHLQQIQSLPLPPTPSVAGDKKSKDYSSPYDNMCSYSKQFYDNSSVHSGKFESSKITKSSGSGTIPASIEDILSFQKYKNYIKKSKLAGNKRQSSKRLQREYQAAIQQQQLQQYSQFSSKNYLSNSSNSKNNINNAHNNNSNNNTILPFNLQNNSNLLPTPVSLSPPIFDISQTALATRDASFSCWKCHNSNFKNFKELQNHHKFCTIYQSSPPPLPLSSNQQHQQQIPLLSASSSSSSVPLPPISNLSNHSTTNESLFNSSIQHWSQHQQQQLLSQTQPIDLISSINNISSSVNTSNRSSQLNSHVTSNSSLLEDHISKSSTKISSAPNGTPVSSTTTTSLLNLNDKPIEITPNLNHYLTQVEQKHKNLLQQHIQSGISHNQSILSSILPVTGARDKKLNWDPYTGGHYDHRFSTGLNNSGNSSNSGASNSFLNSGYQSKKKLSNLPSHLLPASFLDNENIVDYPIIQDPSNIYELNGTPLNFKPPTGHQKSQRGDGGSSSSSSTCSGNSNTNAGLIKDLRRLSNSYLRQTGYGNGNSTNSSLNQPMPSMAEKLQSDKPINSANSTFHQQISKSLESLEPIMLKVKQNKFSPILPPEQLLTAGTTPQQPQSTIATQSPFNMSVSAPLSSSGSSVSSFQNEILPTNLLSVTSASAQQLNNLSSFENLSKKNGMSEIQLQSQRINQAQNAPSSSNCNIVTEKEVNNIQTESTTQQNTVLEESVPHQLQLEKYIQQQNTIITSKNKNGLSTPLSSPPRKRKRLYQCSSCYSYHEDWNLFLHMREMHKRHICLVCLRMFPTAEQLTVHLEMKHDIEQNHFETQEKLLCSTPDSCYLMCCICEHIFTEHEDFNQHICANFLKPCSLCNLLGKHAINCRYGAIEMKKNKRQKKLHAQNETGLADLQNVSVDEIIGIVKPTMTKETTNILDQEQLESHQQQPQNINIPQNNQHNFDADHSTTHNASSNERIETNNSDSNNDSDSDSIGKDNGYLEYFNYNDNDLINLYKSNRLANEAKLKEKEEARNKALDDAESNKTDVSTSQVDGISTTEQPMETTEKPQQMPKLTLKISKELLTQAQNLCDDSDDSDEQSSTETDDEENRGEDDDNTIESDIDAPDTNAENVQANISDVFPTKEANGVTTKPLIEELQISTSDSSSNQNESDKSEASLQLHVIKSDENIGGVVSDITTQEDEKDQKEDGNRSSELDDSFEKSQIKGNEDKNDSDMDIDVTCNQGGDIAPISNIHLQHDIKPSIATLSEEMDINHDNPLQLERHQEKIDESANGISQSNEVAPPLPLPQPAESEQQSSVDFPPSQPLVDLDEVQSSFQQIPDKIIKEEPGINESQHPDQTIENHLNTQNENNSVESEPPPILVPIKKVPTDGIELADDDTPEIELSLDLPLDKIPMVTLLRIMLKKTFPICLYCNHARRIAVNGNSLALHMLASHRFSATVDSITAEELLPATIIIKLKSYLNDLNEYFFNMDTYCNIEKENYSMQDYNVDEKIFECFSCRFSTRIHKELYLHNRKMHLRTAILCFMCRSNFYSYTEILCHICPGAQHKVVPFDIKFRCCLCELDQISSAFRLMVHFRKAHYACDVCLENCFDQSRLSSHVWKHKLHHLCYRCGIAYRNKPDITKHLFWKHGTESVLCKRCLQKRWPHVYHFCIPPSTFVCDVCNLVFTRAMYLKVHKRLHTGDAPYPCTEDNCEKKFISRKLLLKHLREHEMQVISTENGETESSNFMPATAVSGKFKIDDDNDQKIEADEMEKLQNESKSDIKAEDIQTGQNADEDAESNIKIDKKKKKRKISETKLTFKDLNLQAPNLSESDSSDDSDNQENVKKQQTLVPNVMLSPPSDDQDDDDETKTDKNSENIINIWKNFKTFQANQQNKVDDSGIEDSNIEPPAAILHVCQSDHDYCQMYENKKEISKTKDESRSTGKHENNQSNIDSTQKLEDKGRSLLISPSKRKQKTPKKDSPQSKSGDSDSSSSDDSSSSSDSSCTCGSNCSCSSSSDSSSDSSSSSDSDSSSSEGRKRNAAKRAAKEERRRNREQSEGSTKANNSDHIDVVTTDQNQLSEPKVISEPVIYESDLETEESDTDEDFYDEHPQKLASEMLAEKRRQLLKQTCMSPSHNFDIVENSRPSTPSLPEDVFNSINLSREKKVKVKKKKRERKASSKNSIPPFKLNLSKVFSENALPSSPFIQPTTPILQSPIVTSVAPNQNNSLIPNALSTVQTAHSETIPFSSNISNTAATAGLSMENVGQNYHSSTTPSAILNPAIRPPVNTTIGMNVCLLPAPIDPNIIRHSTESSTSEAGLNNVDGNLKRSKRARRPNRFYGYSSDDDHQHSSSTSTGGSGAFKPIPPPVLTWRKEDLPTPPRSGNKKLKMSKMKSTLLQSGHKKLFTKSKASMGGIKKSKLTLNMGNVSPGGVQKPKIPTLKIKPVDIVPQVPPSILDHQQREVNTTYQHHQFPPPPPPVVAPMINTLPAVPVHHVDAPNFYPSSKESMGSDSESDEDKLTIPMQLYPGEIKSQPLLNQQSQIMLPKTPKKGKPNKIPAAKRSKSKSGGARTSYNTIPQKVNMKAVLQNLPMEIKEPTPPPPPKEKRIPPALLPNPDLLTLQYFKRNNIRYPVRPPAGARPPREGESVYCYCRCPYDEVSEMIACDGDDCMIEWFHFECVGILVAPQGKWFCAECKPGNPQTYTSQSTILPKQLQQQNFNEIRKSTSNSTFGSINSGSNGPMTSYSNSSYGSMGY